MANVRQSAFRAPKASTVNLTAGVSSTRVAFQTEGTLGASLFRHIRVFNSSSVTVFIEQGDSSVTAALATGFPVPAGAVEVISVLGTSTNLAAITASGGGTFYVTPGEGL